MYEWHGAEVQAQNSGVVVAVCTYWFHLIGRWDVWEPIRAKTIGFNLLFEVGIPCSVWHSTLETLGMGCI